MITGKLSHLSPAFDIVMYFFVLPYSLLLHIGFLVMLLTLISNVYQNTKTIFEFSKIKITAAVAGTAGSIFLPYLNYIFGFNDTPGPVMLNLPAFLSLYLFDYLDIRYGYFPPSWGLYLLYAFFGFIGGWGVGQAIDWFRERRAEKSAA